MLSDGKFALRSLLNAPGFAAVAVLTLALGIGATVAIFSLVDAQLLRPLPYAQPDRLARIYTELPGRAARFRASTAEFFRLRRETRSWQSIDAWRTSGVNFSAGDAPLRITAASVSGGLLGQTLGVAPALGRNLLPSDDVPGAPLVTVISHGFWQNAFGASPSAIGREVLLNGRSHTVIGVMPEAFGFPLGEADEPDLWVPLQIDPALPVFDHSVFVIGRLKPGVALGEAAAELDALVANDAASSANHHFDPRQEALSTHALPDEVIRNVRPALETLFGAVCFLLLIACVNVANLLLSRAEARQREIAIRGALGAGAWRLARQFAIEGLLLSSLGAVLGTLLALGGVGLIEQVGPAGIPRAALDDGRVLAFALFVCAATGLLFALAPLAHVLRRNLHGAIRTASGSTTRPASAQRFRQALIVGQMALAVVLLAGTGLMLRTFWNLRQVDAGFEPAGVVSMTVALRSEAFDGEGARAFWTELDARLRSRPGVESATLSSALPPVAEDFGWGTQIEGFVPVEDGPIATALNGNQRIAVVDHYQVATPGVFATLGMSLISGRPLDARDLADAPKVVIVNETLARAIWGNESALGRRILPAFAREWFTIVGVVADVKNAGVDRPTGTEIYFPHLQVPATTGLLRAPYIVARARGAAATAVVADVRAAVREIDPTLPLAKVRTLEQVVAASQSRPRFLALLLTVFGSVSLALAAVGIYGVIAYSVAQRTKEFGIRIALGARPSTVLARVLRGGLVLTLAGLTIGLFGALALARFLSGFLFGVASTDPSTYAGAALLLGAIAMLASYLAARRATEVDPLVALRSD
jgi:putative ABC transport system permease protein